MKTKTKPKTKRRHQGGELDRRDNPFPERVVLDHDTALQFGEAVSIQVERGHWEAAHATIDAAECEAERRRTIKPMDATISDAVDMRTGNILDERLGLFTLRDLRGVTRERLQLVPNLDERTIDALAAALRMAAVEERELERERERSR